MSQRHIKILYFVGGACTGDLPHTGLLLGRLSLCVVAPWDSVVKTEFPSLVP